MQSAIVAAVFSVLDDWWGWAILATPTILFMLLMAWALERLLVWVVHRRSP